MRIEFPNSDREDFRWQADTLRIGGASDNDLVLTGQPSADYHLRIRHDRRGWVLEVLPQADRVYVNARPVREKALLRTGDIISVGDSRLLLRDDDEPAQRAPITVPTAGRCTVALRAVAGPLSGRVLSLQDKLVLGPQGAFPLELPQGEQASLEILWREGQLWLEAGAASARYPLRVNGVVVRECGLAPGDQIGVAMHRFVVDAPGLEPEPVVPLIELPSEASSKKAGTRGEMGWLIVTAAVIALGIAVALFMHF